MRNAVCALTLVFGLAPGAFAQLSTGDVHGSIVDQSGVRTIRRFLDETAKSAGL